MTDDLMTEVVRLRQRVVELEAAQSKSRWRQVIRLAVIAAMGMAVVTVPVMAADKNGRYQGWGYGADSGGTFAPILATRFSDLNSSERTKARAYVDWLGGYLTAANIYRPDTYSVSAGGDLAGLKAWIATYGKNYPTENLQDASVALVNFLHPKRTKTAPAD